MAYEPSKPPKILVWLAALVFFGPLVVVPALVFFFGS